MAVSYWPMRGALEETEPVDNLVSDSGPPEPRGNTISVVTRPLANQCKEPKEGQPSRSPQLRSQSGEAGRACPEQATAAALTQAVVSIVRQHEAVEAGAPVVAWDVDTLVDAAAVVVVILTLVNVRISTGSRTRR